jgi:hypothetical protein
VLDFRRRDLHPDTRGAAAQVLVGPIMLAEDAEGLGDGFVQARRGDLDGMFDAGGLAARRPGRSALCRESNTRVFYSPSRRRDFRYTFSVL